MLLLGSLFCMIAAPCTIVDAATPSHTEESHLSREVVQPNSLFPNPWISLPEYASGKTQRGLMASEHFLLVALTDETSPEFSGEPMPADKTAQPSGPDTVGTLSKRRSITLSSADSSGEPPRQTGEQWPAATKLRQELINLETVGNAALRSPFAIMTSNPVAPSTEVYLVEWAREIMSHLDSLEHLPGINHPESATILRHMDRATQLASARAVELNDLVQQKTWLNACYSTIRRVEIWNAVWSATQTEQEENDANADTNSSELIPTQIQAVRESIKLTGDAAGWQQFLLLDEIETLGVDYQIKDTLPTSQSRDSRRKIAQRFLARIKSSELTREQQQWLDRPIIGELITSMKQWAYTPVSYSELLKQIEEQETANVNSVSSEIANTVQNLHFSPSASEREIARKIQLHYRNANIRFAISDNLINRLLPQIEPMSVPLRTTAMGTSIRGNSQVESSLAVSLQPSLSQWNLLLESVGDITTMSTGHQSVVEIHTTGNANFQSGTPVSVDERGITYDKTKVDVAGRLRLRRIETDLDQYPLLGGFVRTIAERRFHSMAPQANRIANRTVRDQIRQEIDRTLQEQTSQANEKLDELVIQPLVDMKLTPQVTELRTTQEALVGRFRVAGDWQMAAHTPRPRSPSDSLVSIQIHQSAINNTLEQLLPSGEAIAIDEVLRQIAKSFGQENWETPQDMPEGVEIRFSSTRPVSIQVEDGKMTLTLRIVQLKRGRAIDLRNVIVKAEYRPEVNGLHAYFVRDGHLSITGPNMSMRKRLPARTIFNKVLSTNHALPITVKGLEKRPVLEGLQLTQLELARGWIALALGIDEHDKIAAGPRNIE